MIELDTPAAESTDAPPIRWGKVINQETCIGCHACSVACKMEHDVPLSVNRTYVKQVEVGVYPEVTREFQVTRCNQCDDAPCVPICPVTAMFKRPDGIVDFDREVCIGCKACIAACPYDAIYINPDVHSAEKCNFCAHRIDQGLEPACVIVCPVEAIVVGNLNDPNSEVLQLISRSKADVRKPEKGTNPKVFYVGASDYTLNPSKATYEGAHLYSQQNEGYPVHAAKAAEPKHSVAAARLAYDVPHQAPWHWPVSLYTWTKSISAGAFLMTAILVFAGVQLSPAWNLTASLVGIAFLGLTGILLVADLEHPMRFLRIFTRPQWKSWLVRGSFIILGYGIVLVIQFVLGVAGSGGGQIALSVPGVILAAFTAMYTAFLFAQAKGRDLWQNPMLPVHLLSQATLAGSAAFALAGLFLPLPQHALTIVHTTLLVSAAVHLALILSELVIPHPILDAKRAAHQMIYGNFRSYFWTGLIVGALAPLAFSVVYGSTVLLTVAAVLALVGLFAYEHAYVQGGQSVPLS
ncbi:4Fe-4S dicluster domain-containing protein [Alicyclobacillus sp. ALC3]|uniref:4Fe-4S dicluster domain-containing protein n=1 Tax=Alicyclobacillus sp. ALC3 TaxID=2796143 RepID=UPI002379766E|nr:4Fe-4S dicluster domain-containing protein [Alicyclobacillus sp. ALC3]WDL97595.1 polysulfide reductase NrfD [Alicyclobacillus sp. ALC3]